MVAARGRKVFLNKYSIKVAACVCTFQPGSNWGPCIPVPL